MWPPLRSSAVIARFAAGPDAVVRLLVQVGPGGQFALMPRSEEVCALV
jgi:hypothetical protein